MLYIIKIVNSILLQFQKYSAKIAHNVPAVYDGLTARIEKCVAFLGLANCGCSEPWERSVPQLRWGAE
jgi:hypothetical protein